MYWEDGGGGWSAGAEDGVAKVGFAVHAGRQLAATWRGCAAATWRSKIERRYVQAIRCTRTQTSVLASPSRAIARRSWAMLTEAACA